MALKYTQKPITMAEYNKRMDKIIDNQLPVHEKLIALLEEAAKYKIVPQNRTTVPKSRTTITRTRSKRVVRKGGQ